VNEVQLFFKALRVFVRLSSKSDNGLSSNKADALQRAFIRSDVQQLLSLAIKHFYVAQWQQVSAALVELVLVIGHR
jgi:hypothetical protein